MLSILTASEEGDVVLDIFGGITTGKIARGLNRKFIGYSKDPKTYTEALKIAGLK
jgi:DNA modification methylase